MIPKTNEANRLSWISPLGSDQPKYCAPKANSPMNSINARPVIGSLPLLIPGSFAKGGKQPMNVRAISRPDVASGRQRADKPTGTGFEGTDDDRRLARNVPPLSRGGAPLRG